MAFENVISDRGLDQKLLKNASCEYQSNEENGLSPCLVSFAENIIWICLLMMQENFPKLASIQALA